VHGKSFLNDEAFLAPIGNSAKFSSYPTDINFRFHQVIWCAMQAIHNKGVFVELGTGNGLNFAKFYLPMQGP